MGTGREDRESRECSVLVARAANQRSVQRLWALKRYLFRVWGGKARPQAKFVDLIFSSCRDGSERKNGERSAPRLARGREPQLRMTSAGEVSAAPLPNRHPYRRGDLAFATESEYPVHQVWPIDAGRSEGSAISSFAAIGNRLLASGRHLRTLRRGARSCARLALTGYDAEADIRIRWRRSFVYEYLMLRRTNTLRRSSARPDRLSRALGGRPVTTGDFSGWFGARPYRHAARLSRGHKVYVVTRARPILRP